MTSSPAVGPTPVVGATAEPEPVPDFEWVFACSTVLGSLVRGTRKFTFNGKPIIGGAGGSLGAGVRWCSAEWQRHAPGARGRVARVDNMGSHISVLLSGKIKEARVYLVDDDALAEAAYLLGASMATGPDATDGLFEWSFGLARQPGRTRYGVWMKGPGADDVAGRLRDEVGVDWCVAFRPAYAPPGQFHGPDHCEVHDGNGTWRASLTGGEVRHEEEAIPFEFIALGYEFGTSLDIRTYLGSGLTYPDPSHRPLEPDELASDWPRLGPHGVVYGTVAASTTCHAETPRRS